MYLRVRCTTAGDDDDSCYVRIKGAVLNLTGLTDNWISDNNIDDQIENSTEWFWKQVGNYSSPPGNDYVEFNMNPGTYTLEIAYREDGLMIDGFLITNDTDIDTTTLPDEIPDEDSKITNILFSDDFESPHDYLIEGIGDYDGLLNGTISVIDANISRIGNLFLESANGNWAPGPGPLVYKNISGNFIATVKVTDFAGTMEDRVFSNDCGIIARDPNSDSGVENWIGIMYYPTWTTFVARNTIIGARGEFGQPAGSWTTDTFALAEQYPYLQIERAGSDFYFRISSDGENFLPLCEESYTGIYDGNQTPLVISRPKLPYTLQIGLCQMTYSNAVGYAAFDDFVIEAPLYPILKLDIDANDDPNETQEDFNSFVLADSNGMSFDDITVTFNGYNAFDAYRRSEPNDLLNENIYKDLILAQQSEPGVGYVSIKLEGLEPNEPYNIKLYSWDSNSTGPIVTDWLANYKYLLTTTQDVNSAPPSSNDQMFSGFTTADANGVIFMEAVPGEGTDPNEPFAIVNALVVSSFKALPVEAEAIAVTNTYMGSNSTHSASTNNMYIKNTINDEHFAIAAIPLPATLLLGFLGLGVGGWKLRRSM